MASRRRYDDEDDDRYADDYAPMEPHRGTLILVLGLLSLLVCGLIGPFAWVMGKDDLRKMDAGLMDPRGRDETQAGYICGIIATILMAVALLGMLLWVLVVFFFVGAAVGAAR